MAFERRRTAKPPPAASFWPFGGMILMAAVFFLYAASGLVAPLWGVVVLLGVWVAVFVLCCTWWTTHPKRITVAAVALTIFWFAALNAGGAWLGWTA